MSEHAKAKAKRLKEVMDEAVALTAKMETADTTDATKFPENTPDNQAKLRSLLEEGKTLKESIEQDRMITGFKSFLEDPAGINPLGGDGAESQPFTGEKSIGDQIVELYKANGSQRGVLQSFEAKGFIFPPSSKATFTTTATGLDSSRNYVTPPGGMVLIEQQRLTIRDLLSVGETSQGTVYYPKESSFTNGAGMVGEEGEKPEATLATTSASAPVKKIAVLLKVTDEMWDDFPMLRDYVNTRGRFMVEQKEEDQLLNGSGSGDNITGIVNSSPQTQAKGADTNLDAIHKAITKVRTPASNVGGYEPDGIVMHPTDYQLIRLAKDQALQYYGGGPFDSGMYGNGPYKELIGPWGLRVVVTTAIAAGTALVGAFKLGAQIWQREGINVAIFDQHEDDVAFNRKTIRIEERLALAVYRPSAFCTVTSIA